MPDWTRKSLWSPTGSPDELVGECRDCGKRKLYWNTRKRVAYCHVCGEKKRMDIAGIGVPSFRSSLDLRLEFKGTSRDAPLDAEHSKLFKDYMKFRKVPKRLWRYVGERTQNDSYTHLVFTKDRLRFLWRGSLFGKKYRTRDYSFPGSSFQFWNLMPEEFEPFRDMNRVYVEGPFDALRVLEAGYQVACGFGKPEADRIAEDWSTSELEGYAMLLFDRDAQQEAERVYLKLLSYGVPVINLTPKLEKGDPAECTPKEIRNLLEM